jgi:hypothetical protein
VTALSVIIADANRDLAFLDESEAAPAEMAARGLRLMQALVNELVLLAGGPWVDVDTSAAYTAGENQRIRVTGAPVITKPTSIIVDTGAGSTSAADLYNATRRPIRNFTRIQVIGTGAGSWVYTAELGAWTSYSALALTDENPLGPKTDGGLGAALAVRINRGRGAIDADIARESAVFRLSLAQQGGYSSEPVASQFY